MQENEYCFEVDMNSWKLKWKSLDWSRCCFCYCVILLLFMCNCGDTQMNNNNKITYEQQQSGYDLLKIEQEIYVDWSSCCCCCCSCVTLLLLLWIFHCGGTCSDEQQQQQNYIWTTTRKRSIYIWLHLKATTLYVIMFGHMYPQYRYLVMKSSSVSGQLDIYRCKVSLTCTVRCTQVRCTSPVDQVTLTCTVRHDLMPVRCTQLRCVMRKVVLCK